MATPSLSVTLDDVRAAQDLLSGVVRPTPLEYSRALTDRVGAEVYLKCENLQRAGSFKIRGAYTRMARLSDEEKARGVVAASAGNHAQGVALAAQLLGIEAKVYMPHGAPMPKLLATKAYGAIIEQVGTTIDECLVEARAWEAETGAVLIHPFDHRDIVAGQGPAGGEVPLGHHSDGERYVDGGAAVVHQLGPQPTSGGRPAADGQHPGVHQLGQSVVPGGRDKQRGQPPPGARPAADRVDADDRPAQQAAR